VTVQRESIQLACHDDNVPDDRSERSYQQLTHDHLVVLAGLAAADDMEFRRRHPEWASELLACCLVQGGARHLLHGDRGVKDLDIYLFYALPPGRQPQHFPWLRGATTRNQDFGSSELGRQFYTAADRADKKMAPKIPRWERFSGRRVDIMGRAIAPHSKGPKHAVRAWLELGSRHKHAPERSDWNLSRAPVVCLHPEMGEVWWNGPAIDEPGIEKGLYAPSKAGPRRLLDRRLSN
jgi:hypothetical protein